MADKRLSVALIGNPNAGKSTIFNLLTGLRQHVSNFPGITVDKKIGVFQIGSSEKVDLIDLPGIYSLFPNSKDEKLVVDIITDPTNSNYPDLVLYVADVNNLERHLLLSTQLLDLKIPMIVVLNMIDIAEANEQSIDADALQKELEVPVLTMSGKTGYQINELKNKIEKFQVQLSEIEFSLADADLYLDTNKTILKEKLSLQAEIKKLISENEEQWFDIQQQIEQFNC
jgi:ferrous iron transport protein B